VDGQHVPQSYPAVICKDAEDEEDMVAIGGIRWREGPEARPLNDLLEVVIDDFTPTSIRTSDDGFMDDETDAKNDELSKNCEEQRRGDPYRPQILPTVFGAKTALTDLHNLLHPPQKDGTGYKRPDFDPTLKERLKSAEVCQH
jgi:hypothetical protein